MIQPNIVHTGIFFPRAQKKITPFQHKFFSWDISSGVLCSNPANDVEFGGRFDPISSTLTGGYGVKNKTENHFSRSKETFARFLLNPFLPGIVRLLNGDEKVEELCSKIVQRHIFL